jgi:hypothetical protein
MDVFYIKEFDGFFFLLVSVLSFSFLSMALIKLLNDDTAC